MGFIKEFWEFLKIRKKYWLIPIIVVLALFGGLIVLTQGSAVALLYMFFKVKSILYLFYHDSAACILIDGKITICKEEDLPKKHDANYLLTIEFVLK